MKRTTTEIYAHVAITKLMQVQTASHPAVVLLPRGESESRRGEVE